MSPVPQVTPSTELVAPSAALRDSYGSYVAELEAGGEAYVPFVVRFEHANFDALLARLSDCSRGIGVPPGFVAHSTYWLVQEGTRVVGVSNIRHALTPALRREGGNIGYGVRPSARRRGFGTEILRQSLGRASDLGLTRVLVTSGKNNLGSVKVILHNGGVLDSEEHLPDRGEIVQRYWIDIAPSRRA